MPKLPVRLSLFPAPGPTGKLSTVQMTCVIVTLSAAMAVPSPAQTLTTLALFNVTNGSGPSGALTQGLDGNFYGTTCSGGTYNFGTVFKITTAGALTTLHSFNRADGACPYAGLTLATNGDFYGTTAGGGATLFYGSIFEISANGTFTTLNNLGPPEGAFPDGGLVQTADGNFLGTTQSGGGNQNGTIFRITPAGMLTRLDSFNYSDGAHPYDTLREGVDGEYYGTTKKGGTGGVGVGTVFKVTLAGTLTTLHNFSGSDGQWPEAGLVQATNGSFFGATMAGGTSGAGTIFKITSSGTFTMLQNFGSVRGLIQASDQNIWGVSNHAGNSLGTIFKMSLGGDLTFVYNFDGTDGYNPNELSQGTDGNFYGTAVSGGTGPGTVFRLSTGIGPFVKTLPTSGAVAISVKILGTDLTGATSVKFNGTAATFTVVSSSLITTTVPGGATTGYVTVTTPSGTRQSNARFHVIP